MSIRSLKSGGSSLSLSITQCTDCLQETKGVAVAPLILHFCCRTCKDNDKGWYGCAICNHYQSSHSRFQSKRAYQRHLNESQSHGQIWNAYKVAAAKNAAEARKTPEQRVMEAQQLCMSRSQRLARQYFPQEGPFGDFFRYQVVTGRSGVYSLCIRSNFKAFNVSSDLLSKREVLLDFGLSCLHAQLPKTLSAKVAELTYSCYQLGRQHQSEDTSSDILRHRRIVPPEDLKDVRRRYTEGTRSIYQSLPTAKVHKLGDDHAYSSILDCGTIAMANGITLAHVTSAMTEDDLGVSYQKLWQTPRAVEIAAAARRAGIPEGTKIIFYILWRDDVEPNWTKNNRGSVWLFTITFVAFGFFAKTRACTFPLAVGKSKASHSEIEHLVHNMMRNEAAQPHLLYSGASRTLENVAFFPILVPSDSPEKRKATGTSMGNGTYHARFRCSADHYRLLCVIRPCDGCHAMMRSGRLPPTCNVCANWDVMKVDATLWEKLKLEPKEKYPMSHLDNQHGIRYLTADGKLVPFQVTFPRLRASYRLAFDNFAALRWTKTEVTEFLSVECISGKLTELVIEHGINARIIAQIGNGTSSLDEENQELFLADAEIHSDAYSCPPMLPIWDSSDDISIFVDAPMHLLFLGIIKSSLFTMKRWLKKNGYLADFFSRCKLLNVLLDDVHIEWLRIEDFREGKFGGWLSENFVAFSRIILWFFQDIGSLLREDVLGDDSIPPSDTPKTTWQKKHYVRWLYDRDVQYRGTNAQMRVHIEYLMNRPGGPPLVIDRSGQHAPEQIERVLLSLESMITVLMTDEVDPEVTCPLAELRIKHFLTEFDLLDQSCLVEGQKPKVITASNYLTLVNLPEIMRRFGPLRGFWEGDFCGEKFVKCAKPRLRYGQRANFASNAMDHCHRESSLEIITAQIDTNPEQEAKLGNHWASLMQASRASFSTYDSRKEIMERLSRQKVVSTVVFLGPKSQDGTRDIDFYVVERCGLSSNNPVRFQLYRLEKDLAEIPVTKLTMRYYQWGLAASPTIWGDLLKAHPPPVSELTFGGLLPMVCDTGVSVHMLVCKDRSVYS